MRTRYRYDICVHCAFVYSFRYIRIIVDIVTLPTCPYFNWFPFFSLLYFILSRSFFRWSAVMRRRFNTINMLTVLLATKARQPTQPDEHTLTHTHTHTHTRTLAGTWQQAQGGHPHSNHQARPGNTVLFIFFFFGHEWDDVNKNTKTKNAKTRAIEADEQSETPNQNESASDRESTRERQRTAARTREWITERAAQSVRWESAAYKKGRRAAHDRQFEVSERGEQTWAANEARHSRAEQRQQNKVNELNETRRDNLTCA